LIAKVVERARFWIGIGWMNLGSNWAASVKGRGEMGSQVSRSGGRGWAGLSGSAGWAVGSIPECAQAQVEGE
jgi:hypothetical protein